MKSKRILSLALASALAAAMSVPAFAADTTVNDLSEGASVEITGSTQIPKIEVVVPSSGAVILNPYGMTAEIPEAFGSGLTATAQIISPIQSIENKSGIPIKVTGTVTGTIEGAEFATATAVAETEKKVFLQFAIGKAADKTTAPTAKVTVSTEDVEIAAAAIELDAAADSGNPNVFANFQFSGDASKNPTTAWSDADTVAATLAFTFAPNAPTS